MNAVHHHRATFVGVIARLVELLDALADDVGAIVEPGVVHQITRLDTADRRLQVAGVRVDEHETPTHDGRRRARSLTVATAGSPTSSVVVARRPTRATELAPGPLRERLAAITEPRALLPLVTVHTAVRTATIHDHSGIAACVVTIHESEAIEGWIAEVTSEPGRQEIAARVRAVLVSCGGVGVERDLVELVMDAAGIDPTGTTRPAAPSLEPTMPAIDGFVRVLAHLDRSIAINWDGTLAETDIEFLHDLRIAVRRTRSVISQGKGILPTIARAHFGAEFGWLATETSRARDLDVHVDGWSRLTADLPQDVTAALRPLRQRFVDDRVAAHAALVASLRSDRARHLMDTWSSWLDAHTSAPDASAAAEQPEPDARTPLREVVARQIRAAHRRVVRDGRRITDASPAEALHDLRKDTKRLRYRIECFATIAPAKETERYVRRLRRLQNQLGAHQDAHVHADEVRAAIGRMGEPPSDLLAAAGALIERLELDQANARAGFARRFAAFDSDTTAAQLHDLLDAITDGRRHS